MIKIDKSLTYRDRIFWILVGVMVAPACAFGYGHPIATLLATGPFLISWLLLPATMNAWNRAGAAVGLAVLIQAAGMMANVTLLAANVQEIRYISGWQALPLFLLIWIGSRRNKAEIGPFVKVLAIFMAVGLTSAFLESLFLPGAQRAFDAAARGYGPRPNLLGLIILKAVYAVPLAAVFGAALHFTIKAMPNAGTVADGASATGETSADASRDQHQGASETANKGLLQKVVDFLMAS